MKEGNTLDTNLNILNGKLVFSPQETCRILGVGRNTIYSLLHTGELESIRIGRQFRITREAIYRYLGLNPYAAA